jgi:hypothetical protein
MKIKNKNSGQVIDDLPTYGKFNFSAHYGYLTLTHDKKVFYFCIVNDEINCEDVTEHFKIL